MRFIIVLALIAAVTTPATTSHTDTGDDNIVVESSVVADSGEVVHYTITLE